MSHSDKALKTIALTGTMPDDWQLTPIDWVSEMREVRGWVECPVCAGLGWGERKECERCKRHYLASRASRMRGPGLVPGMVMAKVLVGYVKFPEGTVFDSRFCDGAHCHLCNKALYATTGRVPVHAIAGGKTHGMWVGEDCGRKFLGLTLKRKRDSIIEERGQ